MIDFEKEKFFQRLDTRINAISNLLMVLEITLVSQIGDREFAKKEIEKIEKLHDLIMQSLMDLDRGIIARYED
jgi:hypothetical protein